MSYQTLQAIIGTAIVDSKFRHNLLDDALGALSSFALTPEESAAITSIKAETFQGFVSQLHGWISRAESAKARRTSY
jgi:hypothetical protein